LHAPGPELARFSRFFRTILTSGRSFAFSYRRGRSWGIKNKRGFGGRLPYVYSGEGTFLVTSRGLIPKRSWSDQAEWIGHCRRPRFVDFGSQMAKENHELRTRRTGRGDETQFERTCFAGVRLMRRCRQIRCGLAAETANAMLIVPYSSRRKVGGLIRIPRDEAGV
jgi:hypothetical protein